MYSYRGYYSRKYEHDFYARKKYLSHVETKVRIITSLISVTGRTKKCVAIWKNTKRQEFKKNRSAKNSVPEQNLQNWLVTCITWRPQRQSQGCTTLHTRSSSRKLLMWTSKPTSRAHLKAITSGSPLPKRKLVSSELLQKNNRDKICSSELPLSELAQCRYTNTFDLKSIIKSIANNYNYLEHNNI